MTPHRTRIKICGITDIATALHAVQCGVDAIGLMRVPSSPRVCSAECARKIAACLPPGVEPIEVFRDQDVAAELTGCTRTIQLHGDETVQDVAALQQGHPSLRLRLIRAIAFDAAAALHWDQCADVGALLVDGIEPGAGASFDLAPLASMRHQLTKPLFLAGGLTPGNVGDAIRAVRPFAVDVSSGVEKTRGKKDPELIEAFCAAVRQADETTA